MVLLAGWLGCAGPAADDCTDLPGAEFATADSLGLEEFLALEPDQRKPRRSQAEIWRKRSQDSGRARDRVQALSRAAGLTPDDPEIWLQLANIWRWIGDDLRTKTCLDNAAAAIRALGSGGDPQHLEAILLASEDPYALVRESAARALGNFDAEPATMRLEQLARQDRDEGVRRAAIEALSGPLSKKLYRR